MEVSHTTLLQLRPELSGADIVVVPPCAAHEQANPAPAAATTTEFGVNFMFILYGSVCLEISMFYLINNKYKALATMHEVVLLCDDVCSSL